jgi:hypothetical protein
LHAALLADPRRAVGSDEIGAIADADARENFAVMIRWRDRLLRHRTLEAAYLALMRQGVEDTPPLFIHQLVHVILRNALDDVGDPFVLRAAELMFRPQRLTIHDGSLVAADDELIAGPNGGPVSPLVSMMGLPAAAGVDVLNEDNADCYFQRSDGFDMALDLTPGRRGHAALGAVMARFIHHLLTIEVDIEPLREIRDAPLSWYVGLDGEGTRIGDRLWNGGTLDALTAGRIVALYRLTFRDRSVAAQRLTTEPVYLILAMTADRMLRMKPQNLVVGLPVSVLEPVN